MKTQRKTTNTTTTRGRSMALAPAARLKALRERAGVPADKCAEAWRTYKRDNDLPQKGKPTHMPASPNTWYRFESVEDQGDAKIPYHRICAVIPLLVGRGMPPITEDELWAISDVGMKPPGFGPAKRPAHLSVVPAVVDSPTSVVGAGNPLGIRYRAERGVFLEADRLGIKSFGSSRLIGAGRGDEFAVQVGDDHAAPTYPAGTVLDCVGVPELSAIVGKRVVAFVERAGGSGLGEIVVAYVDSVSGSSAVLKTIDGVTVDGNVVGLIRGRYTPE